ncbi:MAG TPA: hypothetical protein V6C81_17455 [Planktothrix sp.]|jgi:hypothetical protein
MARTVSVSDKGQNRPKPSKAEREAAESLDTGRKAVEKPMQELLDENRTKRNSAEPIAEPIGLEMETKGDREKAE